jgi:hypothetical protein
MPPNMLINILYNSHVGSSDNADSDDNMDNDDDTDNNLRSLSMGRIVVFPFLSPPLI